MKNHESVLFLRANEALEIYSLSIGISVKVYVLFYLLVTEVHPLIEVTL